MDQAKISQIEQAERLVNQMSLEEVIGQLHNNSPALPRMGIPEYNWWNECLHGVARAGLATVFPQAIGLAASWNSDLLWEVANIIADEARAKHHEAARRGYRGMFHGLSMWSPNINLFRDPRWGRGQETYGEDPYLSGRLAVAFIKGLQGEHPFFFKTIATPKHFAAHSGPEALRHTFDVQVSRQDLWESYLPQFEMAVKEGKAYSIMGAYTRLNGEACCASPALLKKILRDKWGFEGYVVSDCGAIEDIYLHHKLVDSPEEAAALALRSGNDLHCMFFNPSAYKKLDKSLKMGLVSEEEIRRAAVRLITARIRLGLYADEKTNPYSRIPFEIVDSTAHREKALQAARESLVLLKNEQAFLPLPMKPLKVAVVGPNGHAAEVQWGNYNGIPSHTTTVWTGLEQVLPEGSEVNYHQGCPIAEGIPVLEVIPSTYLQTSQEKIGLEASYFSNPELSGQPTLSRTDPQIHFDWFVDPPAEGIPADGYSVRWEGFLVPPMDGTYELGAFCLQHFRLFVDEKLVLDNWDGLLKAMPSVQLSLQKNKKLAIRLEVRKLRDFGQASLVWSLPDQSDEDVESKALALAQASDVIVAVMGLSPRLEGEELPVDIEGFKNGDRTKIELPSIQEAFLGQLHATGKPIVLVLMNGGALALGKNALKCQAIVEAWYPGQAGGTAVAELIFGQFNPSGRLPITFYKSTQDLPAFENYSMDQRTYRYFSGEVLYPFGHGLSFTTFEYKDLVVPEFIHTEQEEVKIAVKVKNNGRRPGTEVTQLYVSLHPRAGKVPRHSLLGFRKIFLQPEEEKQLHFTLKSKQLARINEKGERWCEKGNLTIYVGSGQPGFSQNIKSAAIVRKGPDKKC